MNLKIITLFLILAANCYSGFKYDYITVAETGDTPTIVSGYLEISEYMCELWINSANFDILINGMGEYNEETKFSHKIIQPSITSESNITNFSFEYDKLKFEQYIAGDRFTGILANCEFLLDGNQYSFKIKVRRSPFWFGGAHTFDNTRLIYFNRPPPSQVDDIPVVPPHNFVIPEPNFIFYLTGGFILLLILRKRL
jgi:hypothetical protein